MDNPLNHRSELPTDTPNAPNARAVAGSTALCGHAILAAREEASDEQGPEHAADELEDQIQQPLVPRHGPAQDQGPCDGAVDVAAGVVGDGVRQNQDAHAEGERDDEPRRAIARAVARRRAAADRDEEHHGHQLGEGGLGGVGRSRRGRSGVRRTGDRPATLPVPAQLRKCLQRLDEPR